MKKHSLRYYLKRDALLYAMLLPGVLYLIIFKYIPMTGVIIAFEDFKPYWGLKGIFTSDFVGWRWFQQFFNSIYAKRLIWNTLVISIYKLFWGFPAPILLALFLNEIRSKHFKRTVQTVSYIPHFLSWVIIAGLVQQMTSTDGGIINQIIKSLGGQELYFLGDPKYFRGILVISSIWKGIGWESIIYLAAIAGIDQEFYEAAKVDGAGFFRCMWHITLPSILPIISIMLVLQTGDLLDAGFEQILMLLNANVYSVGDVIDTYVYRNGIQNMDYSFSMAVSLFKSVVSLILVVLANKTAHKMGQEGIW